ncbi:MAG: trypsin-like peptidase domain-containing protein [Coriobacteriales bacterium]|jgi:S1-C subfamily serine protease|nr:trypsin-like peptidase domain-containing protein [Coriobacteriales bacterium]
MTDTTDMLYLGTKQRRGQTTPPQTPPKTRVFSQASSLFFAVCLVALLLLIAFVVPTRVAHAAETTAVTADRDGVYLIKVYYETSNGETYLLQYGSGFFVNDESFLTCNHVIEINAEYGASIQAVFGDDNYNDHIVYKVALMRDLEVEVTLNRASVSTDFAIMSLQDTIAPPHSLALGSSADVKQTETVWTLGFPDVQVDFANLTPLSFTASDVTVGSGTVSKLVDIDNTNFIQHNAPMSFGNSGGPLVNDNGVVVGINAQGADVAGGDYNYSISIDQVRTALDKLAIEYTASANSGNSSGGVLKDGLVAVIAEAEALTGNLNDYTTETASIFMAALGVAKSVNGNEQATQEQVDSAISDLSIARRNLIENPNLTPLIIGVVVGAIAVVIIIVIVTAVLRMRKKKKVAVPPAPLLGAHYPLAGAGTVVPSPSVLPTFPQAPASFVPPASPGAPAPANPGNGFATSLSSPNLSGAPLNGAAAIPSSSAYQPSAFGFDATGSGDTTLLNPAVGETSLLGESQKSATLIRVSNNEKVRINRPEFIIGKEQRKVNFVISDNSAVSRVHARITQRDGRYYITDLNTTNSTFVNDKKLPTNTETPLNKGDHITLADEEFEFDV